MTSPNWQNRTMWTGDNLDIMRGMNSESVDLIYLDPPFNSNRNYAAPIGSEAAGAAFKDTWTLSDVDEAWHGEVADREPTIDDAGLTHAKGMKSLVSVEFLHELIYGAIKVVRHIITPSSPNPPYSRTVKEGIRSEEGHTYYVWKD